MAKIVKCKVCKQTLTQDELDFYKRTNEKICMDCESQQLDKIGEEQDRLSIELDETLERLK